MFYKNLIRPWLFSHHFPDPEDAHNFALNALQNPVVQPLLALYAALSDRKYQRLKQTLWGMHFKHPVGLAAGFDKNGVALHPLANLLGVSHIEMGGITHFRQSGNPRPRIFRSPADGAIVHRCDFNNDGSDAVADRLKDMKKLKIPLGLNVGMPQDTPIDQARTDYRYTVLAVGDYVDYFTINVSTPDLRKPQGKERLTELLLGVKGAVRRLPHKPGQRQRPVLIKLSPDFEDAELDEVLGVAEKHADGVVAVNATTRHGGLTNEAVAKETGGLSGAPLRERALFVVRSIRRRLPRMPIIGVGGIFTGADVHNMFYAGANLVQVYTGLVNEGLGMVRRAVREFNGYLAAFGKDVHSYSPNVKRD